METKQFDLLDIISVMSFYLAVLNLQENEEQNNKLDDHLKEQDGSYLSKIIKQNEQIIKLLGGINE